MTALLWRHLWTPVTRPSRMAAIAAAYLLAGIALIATYGFVPQPVQTAFYGLIAFAAPVAVLFGASRNLERGRAPWYLIAAGLTVFALSDVAFNIQHLAHSRSGSVAGMTHTIGYPLLIAGLLLLVKSASGGWTRFALIEIGIMAIALTLVEWVVAETFSTSFHIGLTVGFATVFVYALADGLLLASAEHILVVTIKRAPASLLVFMGVVALLVGDESYALAPHYTVGSRSDAGWLLSGWLLSYVFFGTAALMPSIRNITGSRSAAVGMPVARLVSLGFALATLPVLLLIDSSDGSRTMHAVLAAGGLLLVVLVLIRVSDLVSSVVSAQTDELDARRRAERTRNQFAALIGSLQGGVLLEDPERRVVLANQAFCRIFDLPESPDQLIGTMTPHTGEAIAKLVAEPGPFRRHVKRLAGRRRLRRGEEVVLVDGRSFLRDYIPVFRDGIYEGSLWHYLEITDQKHAELELEEARDQALEATRLKSEFLAVMSHEIRTPMYGVIGAIDLLDETVLNGEQRELTDVLHDSAEGLLSLLNEILDFSKIEAHKLTLRNEELELASVVEGAVDILSVDARQKGLWLSSFVSPAIPSGLIGDSSRLRQVLVNLVGNAVKFTPTGEVTVRAELESADEAHVGIRLTVSDTGIGIPAKAQSQLFQPFTQFDTSTNRTQSGTGLGLAICSRITELMGGTITCESDVGRGTVMKALVSLKRVAVPAVLDAEKPLAGRRGLLIGSHALTFDALESTLEGYGMKIRRTRSVEEASPWLATAHVILCEPDQAPLLPASPPAIVLATRRDAADGNATREVALPVARKRLLALVGDVLAARGNARDAPDPPAEDVTHVAAGTVLVVEDNDINRQLAARQLARLGIPARVVGSGGEALAALARGNYAAVLMDCRMPGMDGFATTQAIRGREVGTGRHVPIIAITADAQRQDRDRCIEAGMDDYLVKPLTLEALGKCLSHWLDDPTPAAEPLRATELRRLVEEVGQATVLELGRLWLDVLDERIESLRLAVEQDDAEGAFAVTHVLKSTSAVFGAAKAARLAAELEAMARGGTVASSTGLLNDLTTELRLVGQALEAYNAAATTRQSRSSRDSAADPH